MKLYIEIVIIFILIFIFLLWKIWFNRSKRKLLKKYNPDDDKARQCDNFLRGDGSYKTGSEEITDAITGNGTGEPSTDKTVINSNRPYQSERFKLLSSATSR